MYNIYIIIIFIIEKKDGVIMFVKKNRKNRDEKNCIGGKWRHKETDNRTPQFSKYVVIERCNGVFINGDDGCNEADKRTLSLSATSFMLP